MRRSTWLLTIAAALAILTAQAPLARADENSSAGEDDQLQRGRQCQGTQG